MLNNSNHYMNLIRKEEGGAIDHFYCSINADVTIGIGHYLKLSSDAAALFNKGIRFYKNNSLVTNVDEVTEDWKRVEKAGRNLVAAGLNKKYTAKYYAPIAELRVKSEDLQRLFYEDYKKRVDTLYKSKPTAFFLPENVQFVLVDTLYNPAKIALFGRNAKVINMWNNFNDYILTNDTIKLRKAKQLYEEVWKNAAPNQSNYHHRVKNRLRMFEIGILANNACVLDNGF